ncbi:hypothetical protein ACRDNQ_00730 [Palleronia sp. KMU-117]
MVSQQRILQAFLAAAETNAGDITLRVAKLDEATRVIRFFFPRS